VSVPVTIINMAHYYDLTRQIARDYLVQVRAMHAILTKDLQMPHEFAEGVIVQAKDESAGSEIPEAEIESAAATLRAKIYAMQELEDGAKKQS
jgi:hypothetical protein